MKKVITLLLAVCLVMTMAVPAFSVEAEEVEVGTAADIIYVNPMYPSAALEDFEQQEIPEFFASSNYLEFEDVVLLLKEGLEARASGFKIKCRTDEINMVLKKDQNGQPAKDEDGYVIVESGRETLEAFTSKLFEAAMAHTGKSDGGDYVRFNIKKYEVGTGFKILNGEILDEYEFTFNVLYNTTYDMEVEVEEKIEEILEGLNLAGKTDYQKIKAIYDYLCKNIDYDYDHVTPCGDGFCTGYEHSAHAALIEGESVCQGYTLALYRMALEAGVDARCIAGIGYGDGINPENHAWNIVKLGDYYYNADATWDATVAEYGDDYEYFLCGDSNFVNHVKNGEAGVSIQGYPDYASAEFNAAYPMSPTDFAPGANVAKAGLSVTSAEGAIKGETTVSVNISENSNAAVIQFALEFDPAKLQVVSASKGAVFAEESPDVEFYNNEGKIYFAWEGLEGLTKGGSILDVTFKVLEAAETGEELAVKFANGTDGGEETVVGSFSGTGSDGKPEYAPMETTTSNGAITATKTTANVTGTAIMWNNKNDAVYLIYPASTEDKDIKADAKLAEPVLAVNAETEKQAPAAYGTNQYSQSFAINGVEAGEYKLAIYKPGKYVVKIVEIEVAADDVNIGEHKMWLYGDVNYDGNVLPNDALQINRYANLMSSIFVSGSEQDKIDRLLAADVNGDENILPNDALQINRYANLLTSIFDTFS